MAKLSKIVKIKQADYSTLLSEGQVTINGVTHVYDPDALYTVVDPAAPEYADSAGYAANAGTAQVAVHDTTGNNIVQTYGKKPLVIEVTDETDTAPEGTFASITQALRDGRIVYLYVYRGISDGNTLYLRITNNGLNQDGYYQFSGYCEGSLVHFAIGDQDDLHFNFINKPAADTTVVHKTGTETVSGNKTFSGTTTFTGTTNLGSKATATTPAATDNDTSVATTAFVKTAISGKQDKVSSSTDNAVVRFNGTTGNIQNSGVTINDNNQVTATKFITSGGKSSQFVKGDGSLDSRTYIDTCSLPYWANIRTETGPRYNNEPEFKSVKINGSDSTCAASTENAVIQYDTATKVVKFVFN